MRRQRAETLRLLLSLRYSPNLNIINDFGSCAEMCIKVWYGIRQHALCEFPGTIWYFPAPILFFEQPRSFEAKHTYHIFYFKMSARKYDGIWRCSNRQHESERARNGSRKHKVPGMNTNFFSLRIETKLFRVMKSLWLIHNFYVYVCVD